jgi:putative flippase GtrA
VIKNLLTNIQPSRKLIKFGITGIGSTLIHVIVASILISGFTSSTQVGNGVAFIIATVFSYTVNTLWSFSNTINSKNAFRFIVASLLGLGLTILISLIADKAGLHYLLGIAIIVTTVPIYTFLVHSIWTYR